jgi:hypothetical protein
MANSSISSTLPSVVYRFDTSIRYIVSMHHYDISNRYMRQRAAPADICVTSGAFIESEASRVDHLAAHRVRCGEEGP